LDAQIKWMVLETVRTIGLDVAGVDILIDKDNCMSCRFLFFSARLLYRSTVLLSSLALIPLQIKSVKSTRHQASKVWSALSVWILLARLWTLFVFDAVCIVCVRHLKAKTRKSKTSSSLWLYVSFLPPLPFPSSCRLAHSPFFLFSGGAS
jgi:hypothetical protein